MSKKDQFSQQMETQFKEWQSQIDKFIQETEKAENGLRELYKKQIETLRDMQDEAWDQFQKIQDANEETWERMKENAEKQWHDFESQLKTFADKFTL